MHLSRFRFVFFFLLLVPLISQGQIRHVRGIKSIELGYGVSAHGSLLYGGYVSYVSSKTAFKLNGYHESGKLASYKFTSTGIDVGGFRTLYIIKEMIYLNAKGGFFGSMDKLNDGVPLFDASGSSRMEKYPAFVLGGFLGVEPEIFISDKFVVVLSASQRYGFGKSFNKARWYSSIGLRYNF